MVKIVPITHNDLGPTSVPPMISLSKGANASSPSKTASTSRCTSFAFLAMRITPMLKSAGKTSPIAVSSFTNPVFWIDSTITTVTTPVTAASKINSGELRSSVIKNPITIPGNIE